MKAMMNNEEFTNLFTCESKHPMKPFTRHSVGGRNPGSATVGAAFIDENSPDTDPHCGALLTLLESMSDKAGARFLIELITHPNQPIHVSELRHLHIKPLMEGGHNPFKENSIPYCDRKTLDDVKKRLKKLQIIKHEAKCCNDYARLDDIYTEEEFLIDYVKKAINRNGEPRYLRDTLRDDYSYVKKTIDRTIETIRKIETYQAEFIQNHLKTGLRFEWKVPYL